MLHSDIKEYYRAESILTESINPLDGVEVEASQRRPYSSNLAYRKHRCGGEVNSLLYICGCTQNREGQSINNKDKGQTCQLIVFGGCLHQFG